jgi:hypothetical protein
MSYADIHRDRRRTAARENRQQAMWTIFTTGDRLVYSHNDAWWYLFKPEENHHIRWYGMSRWRVGRRAGCGFGIVRHQFARTTEHWISLVVTSMMGGSTHVFRIASADTSISTLRTCFDVFSRTEVYKPYYGMNRRHVHIELTRRFHTARERLIPTPDDFDDALVAALAERERTMSTMGP